MLGSVAGAIAAAGVDVHSAEIGVEGTAAVDTFELTGARGKLGPDERDAIVDNVRHGAALDSRRRGWGRAWDRLRSSWSSASDQAVDIDT